MVVELRHLRHDAEKFFGGPFFDPLIRTLLYVVVASLICLVLGYAVAYYVARLGGRARA